MRSRFFVISCVLVAAIVLQSCADRRAVPTSTPVFGSPALSLPAPMARTAVQPASAMLSATRRTRGVILPPAWSQVPGAASQVSAAADGTVWVLSTLPSGPDKYIWHYAGGSWTNISGLASQIAVAPNGTLFAINSGGGAYSYSGGNWTAFGGGASAIAAAPDNSLYVMSNGGRNSAGYPIWHYSNGWSPIAGAGIMMAANNDPATYRVPAGTLSPGGLYVVNAAGLIYYTPGDGSYIQLPGAASSIAATSGGMFVLAYPTDPNGNTIYYYNFSDGTWKAEPGAGVSVSATPASLYVVSASGGIFTTPVVQKITASPSALTFYSVGSGSAKTASLAETGYTGTFTVTSNTCSGIATYPSSTSSSVLVTPVAAGNCSITLTDSGGNNASVPVTVTTTSITGQ